MIAKDILNLLPPETQVDIIQGQKVLCTTVNKVTEDEHFNELYSKVTHLSLILNNGESMLGIQLLEKKA